MVVSPEERQVKIRLIFGTALLVCMSMVGASAYADTVDFEAQGGGRGSVFTGTVDSPLVIGIATFTGGELLDRESRLSADQTAVYATTNFVSGGYTDPLTISFSAPVSGFSVFIADGIGGGIYTVSDNLGGSVSQILPSFTSAGAAIFTLSDLGITSVSIFGPMSGINWDYSIDNVTFTPASPAPVPEPSSGVLAGVGLVTLFGLKRLLS